MELAQLMGEAERLGFSAAEVQAALTQSPAAPLAWLRERWPSLCAGVRAAAARLAPTAAITELEARAALARHRGAMWPAVTECVDRHRRQVDYIVLKRLVLTYGNRIIYFYLIFRRTLLALAKKADYEVTFGGPLRAQTTTLHLLAPHPANLTACAVILNEPQNNKITLHYKITSSS